MNPAAQNPQDLRSTESDYRGNENCRSDPRTLQERVIVSGDASGVSSDERECRLLRTLLLLGIGACCSVVLVDVVASLGWDPGAFVDEVAAVAALGAEVSLVHRLCGPFGVHR
ncbi:hypothetical protein [Rhodococcus qingshengii]|uniref:hypothetical protein n=1 Tax=Rhodococcus qingshengii TaxID=334542 RepID=UPI0024BB7400|nr:hypothetical protein [Rhodococcus qingshengii]MDJ0441439.1 hypothetical protein [Rhodococcus qingshengii]